MAHPVVTLTKSPENDVIAAYNCIEFCYEVTDNITVVGTESFLDLQVDNAIVEGKTMTIFGQQFLFTNLSVNDDGHKVALGVDEFEQRDFIYDTLLTNYEISSKFNVAKVSNDRISFTAKKKGADYDINFSSTSTDLQINTQTSGTDMEVKEAYKVIGVIQIRINGEWEMFDEEVRDVSLKLDSLGNFKSQVCFKLHGILRSYFKNQKPDLENNFATINEWAVYEFRFGIVDFKADVGQVSTSGYFDRGIEIYTVLNGMHKVESELKLTPYYENQNKGVYLSLNQIPTENTLCTDNNTYLSVFVRDKDQLGFGVQVVGDIYFADGTIENNHTFSGFTGVGSAVVVLPIGPRNIQVCNDAIWSNQSGIIKYTYRAFVYSNVESENLFTDGDNGTFEADVLGVSAPASITKTQTADGYVGNAVKLTGFNIITLNPLNQLILTGNTAIAFVQGFVYFLEAWVKVKGLDCRCFENLFKDAHYGTFDGVNPMDVINIISGATSELINGYEGKSLLITDLQSSSLSNQGFLMIGNTLINFKDNEVFELTAWVKVTGIADCESCVQLDNLFLDGAGGTFESGDPWLDIVVLSGITKSIGVGNGSAQAMDMEIGNATITSGANLFYGNTPIQFLAGKTYKVKMQVKISDFDCNIFGNLFVDGDYGDFEANQANITTLAGITQSTSLGYPNIDTALQLQTIEAATLAVGSILMYGASGINFQANTQYTLSMQIRASIDPLLFGNMFLDGNIGDFESGNPWANIIPITGATQDVGAGDASAQALVLRDLDAATITSGSILFYGDTSINFIAGLIYVLTMRVKVSDVDCAAFGNQFQDGDSGTFESGNPWANIIPITGATQDVGAGDASAQALVLRDLDAATITSGSTLFYGDTLINFIAGLTYVLTMRVQVSDVDCVLLGQLFADGDNGTFEANITNMASDVSEYLLSQSVGSGRLGTNALLIENLIPATVSNGDFLTYGSTTMNFIAGETYKLTAWIDLEGQGLVDASTDGAGVTFLMDFFGSYLNTDFNILSQNVVTYNSATVPSIGGLFTEISMTVEFNINKTLAVGILIGNGASLISASGQEIYLDDFYVENLSSGAFNFSVGIDGGIGINGTEIENSLLVVDSTCGQLDTWYTVQTTITVTTSFTGKVGLKANGAFVSYLQDLDVLVYADNVDLTALPSLLFTLRARLTSPIGANGTEVINTQLVVDSTCAQLDAWYTLQTTITVTNNFTGKVGLIVTGGVVGILEDPDVLVYADNVSLLVSVPSGLFLEASLLNPIGANGTQTTLVSAEIADDSNNDIWYNIITDLVVTNDFTDNVGLKISGLVALLRTGYITLSIDKITVSVTNINVIELYAALTSPIGVNGSQVLNTILTLDASCSQIDTWIQLETTLNVVNDFIGQVGLQIFGDNAYLLANTVDIVDIYVDNVEVFDTEGDDLQFRLTTETAPTTGSFNYQKMLQVGSNCPLNEWTELKTVFTKGSSTEDLKIGLQVVGNVNCLLDENVEVVIDNIQVKSLSQSGVRFEITTTEGANVMQNFELNNCEEQDTWRKVTSIYIPQSSSSEEVRIVAKNMYIGCLENPDVEIYIDEIVVRGYNDAHASMTQEQTVMLKDNCDCTDDCCNEEFAYRNELGQFDFIHLECIKTETTNVEMTNVDTCIDCDDDIADFGAKTINAKSVKSFVINARITRERKEQFEIFMASIEKYHVVDNQYLPINARTIELQTFKKVSKYIDVDIEFEYKIENPTLIA